MKTKLAACALALCVPGASAQEMPETMKEYFKSIRPALPSFASIGFEHAGDADFENGAGDASWTVYELRAPFYLYRITDSAAISLGVDYSLTDLDVDLGDRRFSESLHGLFLPISYTHTLGNEWFLLGQLAPGLRTDFDGIGSDDFAIRGFFGFMKRYTDRLVLGYGGFVSYDVDGFFGAPGIGGAYRFNDQWAASLIPPELGLNWFPDEDWVVSVNARARSFVADLNGSDVDPDFAKVSYGRAGLSVRRRLFNRPDLWLNVQGGMQFLGEVEMERSGRSLFDGDLDPGWYVGTSVQVFGW